MSDTKITKSGAKKTATKKQAVIIMITGGIIFALAIIIPTEQGSTAQHIKTAIGAAGLGILTLGAYLRPMNKPAEKS
jgi:hypothetical protein